MSTPQLAASVVPIVLILTLIMAMARPPVIRLTVVERDLMLRFGILDAIWLMSRTLSIPLSDIQRVAVSSLDGIPQEDFRLPGAALPGVIRAGYFGTGDRRDVWDVRNGDEVLRIDLRPGSRFRRIVLQVADPDGEAARLTAMIGGGSYGW